MLEPLDTDLHGSKNIVRHRCIVHGSTVRGISTFRALEQHKRNVRVDYTGFVMPRVRDDFDVKMNFQYDALHRSDETVLLLIAKETRSNFISNNFEWPPGVVLVREISTYNCLREVLRVYQCWRRINIKLIGEFVRRNVWKHYGRSRELFGVNFASENLVPIFLEALFSINVRDRRSIFVSSLRNCIIVPLSRRSNGGNYEQTDAEIFRILSRCLILK